MPGALSVIQSILRGHPAIPSIEFALISERSPIQDDEALTNLERGIVYRAENLRKESGVPFWTACLSILDNERVESDRIIQAATFHRPVEDGDIFTLSREEVLNSSEVEIMSNLDPHDYVAIRSRVNLSGQTFQIPMIDMRIGISDFGRSITVRVAESLLPDGHVVLQTDSSYHIYGKHPVTPHEWQRIMGWSLLFSPFVDSPWVAHQLIEGSCALRLGPKPGDSRAPSII